MGLQDKKYSQFQEFHFNIADYVVFGAMLIMSTGTGVYFGYYRRHIPEGDGSMDERGKRRGPDFGSNKMSEYLLGSRMLKVFPVAMSLLGSYISGVTMLGTPSEVYYYGTQYWFICISIVGMSFVVSNLYLPVFSVLRVGSSYEYLEMRFNSYIRSIASFMFVMDEVFFLPMIVYVPAIAFNQVTGVNIHIVSGVVCVACVTYTLVGGIKAVVHTDAWQIVVMFISLTVVAVLGTIIAGGPGIVIQRAREGGRLIFFNTNPSLYERETLWAVLFGGFSYWTSFNSVNQTMVQRYISLPTLKKGKQSIAIFTLGVLLFVSVCCFSGLLVYNFYRHCDPATAGLITNDDQLLPIYVMQTVGHLPGIPGLFIAGVFGAALSSLSVVLNSTSLVLLEDILRGCFKLKLSEKAATIFVKSVVIILGAVALSLVFVLDMLSGILSIATSMTAIAAGTTFGIFTLGMMIPWSNSKGAAAGAIAGAFMSGWISFGSQAAIAAKLVVPHKLPVSVAECPGNYTVPAVNHNEDDVFPLYRLSFHWINPIGVLTTVFVGVIASFLTGSTVLKNLDADLISPVIHRFLPKECFSPARIDTELARENMPQTRLLSDNDKASTNKEQSKKN